jgi:hypothetical protein
MTEQQLLEKYAGIVQFQVSFYNDEGEEILERIAPLVDISFDKQAYIEAKGRQKSSIYLKRSQTDARCLVLVEFMTYSHTLIVRCKEEAGAAVRELLRRNENKKIENTLIKHSMMNAIVRRYGLNIDIVDEFDLWNTVFKDHRFWWEYVHFDAHGLYDDDNSIYPELVDPIRFPITEDAGLMVWIGDYIDMSSLHLFHPSLANSFELGWDDLGRWHPHALKWEEFEKLYLFLTLRHPEQFVVPFLLMLRFAVVTRLEDVKAIARKVKVAWRSLGLFSEEEIEQFDRMVWFKPHFEWTQDPVHGWYHACDSPDDVYSMRHVCSGEFPFQALAEVMQAIDRQMDEASWKEAVAKWDALVETYSIDEDEHWLERRGAEV